MRPNEKRPSDSKNGHAMALDQAALLEVVGMLKASDDGELMRKMLTTML